MGNTAESVLTVHRTGVIESLFACAECGAAFVPIRSTQKRCGKLECLRAYQARRLREKTRSEWGTDSVECVACAKVVPRQSKTQRTCFAPECQVKANWILHKRDNPAHKAANRTRFAKWYAAKTGGDSTIARAPWLLGAPIYGEQLPGGICSIDIRPAPKWPIELRSTRALHGCITSIADRPHTKNLADFALIPGDPWRVYIRDENTAIALAYGRHEGELFGKRVMVGLGPLQRLPAPIVAKRGRRRLTIETITPVSMRRGTDVDGKRVFEQFGEPNSDNLHGSLVGSFLKKIGVRIPYDHVKVELKSADTIPTTIPIGGKYGDVVAWEGRCVVETNAVGEWLLRCAEMIGFGGRTAFGFGRIMIR